MTTDAQTRTASRAFDRSRSSAASRSTLRFKSLTLENWRNFKSVDVKLSRRVFLVGPNASGKSNLIDTFRFLHDISEVGGGLQAAVRRRSGVSALRCLSARRYSDIAIKVTVGSDDSADDWKYELHISQDNLRRAVVKKESVKHGSDVRLSRPDADDQADPERQTQTYLEQVNVNKDFRELSDFFVQVRYKHIVPQLIREPDRSVGHHDDPFGGDFLEQLARTNTRIRESRLRRIREALQVAVPQLQDLEMFRDDAGTPHLRGKYEHWRPQGAWQTEEQFSDGSLRLLGLLWAVLDGQGPLLLEEPELSLHPEVVRYIPQLMARIQRRSGRQIVMSTHSPELLDDEGIGIDEVLMLRPTTEGTSVAPASSLEDITTLLGADMPLSEILVPHTRPKSVEQLALFGE